MSEFVCITQHSNIQTHVGPSGEKYVSLRGKPFKVSSKDDAKHFSNQPQRFRKVGIVQRVANKISPPKDSASASDDEEKEIDSFLEKAGLSKKSQEKVKRLYGNMNGLYSEFIAGSEFKSIPRAQAKRVLKLLEDYSEEKHEEVQQ